MQLWYHRWLCTAGTVGGLPYYGESPLRRGEIRLAVDEDQVGDSERSHTTEQVAYLVFERTIAYDEAIDVSRAYQCLRETGIVGAGKAREVGEEGLRRSWKRTMVARRLCGRSTGARAITQLSVR